MEHKIQNRVAWEASFPREKKKKPPDHRVFLGRRVVTNVEKVWTNHLIWM
jgi:hypothetical protein